MPCAVRLSFAFSGRNALKNGGSTAGPLTAVSKGGHSLQQALLQDNV